MKDKTEQVRRWRLILGSAADSSNQEITLNDNDTILDNALDAIYSGKDGFSYRAGDLHGGNDKSSPYVARWLGDIRRFFKEDTITVIQADAMERKGLLRLLLEPELLKTVVPDMALASTLVSLKNQIPEKARAAAREIIEKVVNDINKNLASQITRSVTGSIRHFEHSPICSKQAVDWKKTIVKNLGSFDHSIGSLVPSKIYFHSRGTQRSDLRIILCMDQSGSMAESIIYGSVVGSILSKISSLSTNIVSFSTDVVDLTDKYEIDPVEMVFGIQMGGGTDIENAVRYCEELITEPKKTILFLLSDMFEGGNRAALIARISALVESGVTVVGLLSISDTGHPAYDHETAKLLSNAGAVCAAVSPNNLAVLLSDTFGRALSK